MGLCKARLPSANVGSVTGGLPTTISLWKSISKTNLTSWICRIFLHWPVRSQAPLATDWPLFITSTPVIRLSSVHSSGQGYRPASCWLVQRLHTTPSLSQGEWLWLTTKISMPNQPTNHTIFSHIPIHVNSQHTSGNELVIFNLVPVIHLKFFTKRTDQTSSGP